MCIYNNIYSDYIIYTVRVYTCTIHVCIIRRLREIGRIGCGFYDHPSHLNNSPFGPCSRKKTTVNHSFYAHAAAALHTHATVMPLHIFYIKAFVYLYSCAAALEYE